MMKIIAFLLFLHTASSLSPSLLNSVQPVNNPQVKYEIDVDGGQVSYESDADKQTYSYRLHTLDGSEKHESGHFEEDNLIVEGGYEFIGSNGILYKVTYTADKNGYQPRVISGAGSLPTTRPSFSTTTRAPPTTPPPYRPPLTYPTTKKPIDPALLCSLAGSGCK